VMTVVDPHVKDVCVRGQMLRLPPNMQLNSSKSAGSRISELYDNTVPSFPCTSAEDVTPLKLQRVRSTRLDHLVQVDSSLTCSSPEVICCPATPEAVTPQLPRRFIKSAHHNLKSEIKSKTEGKTFSKPPPNRLSKFIQKERESYYKQSPALPSQTALFCEICHARPQHNNLGVHCDGRLPRLCFVCSQRSTEKQRSTKEQWSPEEQRSTEEWQSTDEQQSTEEQQSRKEQLSMKKRLSRKERAQTGRSLRSRVSAGKVRRSTKLSVSLSFETIWKSRGEKLRLQSRLPSARLASKRALEQALAKKRNSFDQLSVETCVSVLEFLLQPEVFRAAATCSAVRTAASEPRLFERLDLRVVGKEVSFRGRKRVMAREATICALGEFICQSRFADSKVVDLRSCYIGEFQTANFTFLHALAKCCPKVHTLRLDSVAPAHFWSDLARYLPTRIERTFKQVWSARPLTLRFAGRTYTV